MNRSQLEEIKKSIKSEYELKINKLTSEMQDALASLDKVEETLFASNLIQTELKISDDIRKVRIGTASIFKRTPSVRTRILNILEKTTEGFTTSQILDALNNDGTEKPINKNSFFPEFSRLKKENIIVVVTEQAGNKPGKYKKAESSTASSISFT